MKNKEGNIKHVVHSTLETTVLGVLLRLILPTVFKRWQIKLVSRQLVSTTFFQTATDANPRISPADLNAFQRWSKDLNRNVQK